MSKYKKKPVVIEAVQYTGYNHAELRAFAGRDLALNEGTPRTVLSIRTLEGEMFVNVNDFIIKGVRGEFYPCKPDIFYLTYDKVEEEEGME